MIVPYPSVRDINIYIWKLLQTHVRWEKVTQKIQKQKDFDWGK